MHSYSPTRRGRRPFAGAGGSVRTFLALLACLLAG